jgi:hypothetical protein
MSLTARKERLPSGRSNLNSARLPQLSPSTSRIDNYNQDATGEFGLNASNVSLSATLYQKRKQKLIEDKTKVNDLRSSALGGYNEFSVPRVSSKAPLRTVFLDPEVNNFPKSKTRTELLERIKKSSRPDISYDIDGDGFVSQEDFKLSKIYDIDSNGILESEEVNLGQEMRARLRSLQIARKKQEILECLTLPPMARSLIQHNFYTNKLDASAWNDFDAIPRSASDFGIDNHGGSRKRLLFSRTLHDRANSQELLEVAYLKSKVHDNRRTNQITDVAYENN